MPAVADPSPLILTLAFQEQDQARFDALRARHFPVALNRIPAHVTLFHALPGLQCASIAETLRTECTALPPFTTEVAGLRFLGRGVAYELRSEALGALRARLARAWKPWLTLQDAQGYRPHITLQNKVAPDTARRLLHDMQLSFAPFAIPAVGLTLWWYRGGPWELAHQFRFHDDPARTPTAGTER